MRINDMDYAVRARAAAAWVAEISVYEFVSGSMKCPDCQYARSIFTALCREQQIKHALLCGLLGRKSAETVRYHNHRFDNHPEPQRAVADLDRARGYMLESGLELLHNRQMQNVEAAHA